MSTTTPSARFRLRRTFVATMSRSISWRFARIFVSRSVIASSGTLAQLEEVSHLRVSRDEPADRKSTCLNSSHLGISYAVFCLKKITNARHTYQHRTGLGTHYVHLNGHSAT